MCRTIATALVAAILGLLLFAQGTAAGRANDLPSIEQQLADKFTPIVALKTQTRACDSEGEPFVPAPVDVIFNDPRVSLRRHIKGGSAETDPVIKRAPVAADLYGLGEDYYLDLPGNPRNPGCGYEQWFRSRMAGFEPSVYARIRNEGSSLVLQYWFYYVFNDFNNKHESDWEMMQIVFDVPTVEQALSTEPVSIALAQHGGGETAEWNDRKLQEDGNQPIVYPAAGSHATFYSNGTYLGWGENGTGFGCDKATPPSTRVVLTPILLTEDISGPSSPLAWLTYQGTWGELSGGEYDGPTGPNMKGQWQLPLEWQANQRASSIKIPGASTSGPGPTQVFCSLSAFGSTLFTDLAMHPNRVLGFVAALLAAAIGLFVLGWPIIRAAFAMYRNYWRTFALIGIVLIPIGIIFSGLQYLATSLPPGNLLVQLLNEQSDNGNFAAAMVTGIFQQIANIAIVGPAVIEAFRQIELNEPLGVVEVYRRAFQRFPDTTKAVLIGGLVVVPLVFTVIGIPMVIWLLGRWAFTPQAVMLDGARGRAALQRSAASAGTYGHWLRSTCVILLLVIIGAAPGPIIGLALLILRSSSVSFANTVSSLVFAAFLPFSVLGLTLLYRQGQERHDASAQPLPPAPDTPPVLTTGR
jgi:hypothetical protein